MYNSKWKVFKHIPSTCDEYEWTSKSNEMHNINEGKRRWGRAELWLYPSTIATEMILKCLKLFKFQNDLDEKCILNPLKI